jgi:hypothetical protein
MKVMAIFIFSVMVPGALFFVPAGRFDYMHGWIWCSGYGDCVDCCNGIRCEAHSIVNSAANEGCGRYTSLGSPFVIVLELLFVAILVVGDWMQAAMAGLHRRFGFRVWDSFSWSIQRPDLYFSRTSWKLIHLSFAILPTYSLRRLPEEYLPGACGSL